MDKELGQTIKNARRGQNLTLQDVADFVGVNQSTVSRWETGAIDARRIKADKIGKLCKILNLSVDTFTDLSIAQTMMLQSINDISMNLDEPTQELLYAILDLSPIQKMTILQMIRAMTGGKDE